MIVIINFVISGIITSQRTIRRNTLTILSEERRKGAGTNQASCPAQLQSGGKTKCRKEEERRKGAGTNQASYPAQLQSGGKSKGRKEILISHSSATEEGHRSEIDFALDYKVNK